MAEFRPMMMLEDADPEGWLGDPNEWPSLFLRNHVIRNRSIIGFPESDPMVDPPGNWLDHTGHSTTYVYMSVEDCGEEDLEYHLLSAMPDIGRRERYATWLEFEINTDESCLWETVFGTERPWGSSSNSQTPVADWALQNGICPGQWFVVKLEPHYSCYEDYWYGGYECDFECDATMLDREKLPPEEHARRWLEFMTGRDLEDGLPRLAETRISGTDAVSLTWVCAPKSEEKP